MFGPKEHWGHCRGSQSSLGRLHSSFLCSLREDISNPFFWVAYKEVLHKPLPQSFYFFFLFLCHCSFVGEKKNSLCHLFLSPCHFLFNSVCWSLTYLLLLPDREQKADCCKSFHFLQRIVITVPLTNLIITDPNPRSPCPRIYLFSFICQWLSSHLASLKVFFVAV